MQSHEEVAAKSFLRDMEQDPVEIDICTLARAAANGCYAQSA
tara:strand:+ start:666 stop:791 length:126 start_codon:yes stop_codon:yes gene_type:complete